MPAILPEQFEYMTINKMVVGDSGYTVPWAMWVDKSRNCWLHPDYTLSAKPGGTVEMRVEKRKNGFHVWLAPGENYSPSSEPGFVGTVDEFVPVEELHY